MSDTEDPDSPTERALTARQERFCQLYTNYWNATRAAKGAGYSEKTAMEQGYQLLQKPSVRARISELSVHALEEIGVTRERVLTELARIAFVNMKDLATWNESGVRFKPSDEIEEATGAVIQEVTETVSQHGGNLKIKQHDKVRALELLGKHHKLFADRHELSGPDGAPIETKDVSTLSNEEIDARLEKLRAKDSGQKTE